MSDSTSTSPSPKTYETLDTISEMMRQLQNEINETKSGVMTESMARVVIKQRGVQVKLAELQIQHARLFKGRAPDPEMRLIGPAKTEEKAK